MQVVKIEKSVILQARKQGKSVIIQANKQEKSVIHPCSTEEYNIPSAIVLDNEREVYTKNGITYMPIYYIMCIERAEIPQTGSIF